jgi:hypothetical protein
MCAMSDFNSDVYVDYCNSFTFCVILSLYMYTYVAQIILLKFLYRYMYLQCVSIKPLTAIMSQMYNVCDNGLTDRRSANLKSPSAMPVGH